MERNQIERKKLRAHSSQRLVLCLLSMLLLACGSKKPVEQALELAGENRKELEKVLDHYKEDSLKRAAAEFLIAHMPGAYSPDPKLLETYQPFYKAYDSLAQSHHYLISSEWGEQVDRLWSDFGSKHGAWRQQQADIGTLSATYLIGEIELAFKAWKENRYTRHCSFEDFCEYILPYRRQNGLLVDDARQLFYERHHGTYFAQSGKNFVDEADSLLFAYRQLTHSNFWGTQIPIWNAATFETLRHGLCAQRCWYNSILFSSLGMAAAVDFVPAWGNRNSAHTWNVLIVDGKSYAFESFWDNDRWKYKELYNNRSYDRHWGRFRLPKVYRFTYSNHFEGPLVDRGVRQEDVPALFRNFKKKDVSSEYFETTDVSVNLEEKALEGIDYAYLAVFDYREWRPVQWGRIEDGKAVFKGMGREIVYLPVYCKNGQLKPAAAPFYVNSSGESERLAGSHATETIALRIMEGSGYYTTGTPYVECMNGTVVWGMQNGEPQEKLVEPFDRLNLERTHMKVNTAKPYRFVRLQLPSDSIALGDIGFYTAQGLVQGVTVTSAVRACDANETLAMLTDGVDAIAFRGKTAERFIDVDLGSECQLTKIVVSPYLKSQLNDTDIYELLYWKNGWQSLGSQQGSNSYLRFSGVPTKALLRLKNRSSKGTCRERVFIYKEGEVMWN